MKRIIILVVLLAFGCFPVDAAFNSTVRGARPMGMGGAFTAVADDSNAIIYNPAGIVQLEKTEASFMYAKLYAGLEGVDLGLNYFAVVMPLNSVSGFGFSWSNFSSRNVYQEDILSVSYGRLLTDYLSGGLNIKYLGHQYTLDRRVLNDPVFSGGDSKYSFSVDAGLFSKFDINDEDNELSLGVSAINLNQPDIGLKTADKVPMELTLGTAYHSGDTLVHSLDIGYRFQDWGNDTDKIITRLGFEMWLSEHIIGLRAGYDVSNVSFGFSFNPQFWKSSFQLDYALLWPIQIKESIGNHHLSLTFRFN